MAVLTKDQLKNELAKQNKIWTVDDVLNLLDSLLGVGESAPVDPMLVADQIIQNPDFRIDQTKVTGLDLSLAEKMSLQQAADWLQNFQVGIESLSPTSPDIIHADPPKDRRFQLILNGPGPWSFNNIKMANGDPATLLDENSDPIAGNSITAAQKRLFNYIVYTAATDTWQTDFSIIGITEKTLYPSSNLLAPQYLKENTIVGSTGNVVTNPSYAGAVAIAGFPVSDLVGQYITLGGHLANAGKYVVFKDAAGTTVGSIGVLSTNPRSFLVPSGSATFNASVKKISEESLPNLMLNVGQVALPYEPYVEPVTYVGEIEGTKLGAVIISEGNEAPDPVNPKNVTNKRWVQQQLQNIPTVLVTTANVVTSKNILNPAYVYESTVVGSTGNVITNPATYAGAYTVKMPCAQYVGKYICISGYNSPNAGKYVVFKNASNQTVGSISNLNSTFRYFLVPEGAITFCAYFKFPSEDVVPDIMINMGQVRLPYEEFTSMQVADKINNNPVGIKVIMPDNEAPDPVNPKNVLNLQWFLQYMADNGGGGGGVSYFKDLQDVPALVGNEGKVLAINSDGSGLVAVPGVAPGSDLDLGIVTADSISVGQAMITTLVLNLPEGAGSVPVGVDVGEAWIDTNASDVVKVRRL